MSGGEFNLYTKQYSSNLELLLQKMGSMIRPYVTTGFHTGEGASPVNQEAQYDARDLVPYAPKGRTDSSYERRWVSPMSKVVNPMVAKFDEIRTFADLTSQKVQNAAYALGRAQDQEIIRAIHQSNKVGKDYPSTASRALPAAQKLAVDSSALTIAKVKRAKARLEANHVSKMHGPVCCLINARQKLALLEDAEIINKDYVTKSTLEVGRIPDLLGVHFVEVEDLMQDSSGNDLIPMFAKSGVYLGLWDDINVSINRRTDLEDDPWEAYTKSTFGATRIEEGRVVEIACQTTGLI